VLTVPVSSPVMAKAGQLVMFTVSATDPDVGQTVTLSAVGGVTDSNPFAAAVGATFSASTGAFSFPTGVIGTFDVQFQAVDNFVPPGADTEAIVFSVAANDVVLNEVRYGAVGQQDVELRNRSVTAAADVSGWRLCVTATSCYAVPAATSIAASGFLVIHWNQTGTNTATELFTGAGLTNLGVVGTLVLYNGATLLPRTVMDAVTWNVSGGTHDLIGDGVGANQWPSNDPVADGINVTAYVDGNSLAYSGTGETRTSWTLDTTPSFGAAN
jgi:hypothetical protein